jgi:hypothetical protein
VGRYGDRSSSSSTTWSPIVMLPFNDEATCIQLRATACTRAASVRTQRGAAMWISTSCTRGKSIRRTSAVVALRISAASLSLPASETSSSTSESRSCGDDTVRGAASGPIRAVTLSPGAFIPKTASAVCGAWTARCDRSHSSYTGTPAPAARRSKAGAPSGITGVGYLGRSSRCPAGVSP